MTQTLLSAARSTRRGEKLPTPAHQCATHHSAHLAGRIQWHRHSCLCAFFEPSIQRMAQLVTSQTSEFLIENPRLTLNVNDRRISALRISNRERMAILHFIFQPLTNWPDAGRECLEVRRTHLPERTQRVKGRLLQALLIHGSAIKTCANRHCFNYMQISNRRSDQDRRPERTQRVERRLLQALLIHGSAIKTCANRHCFNHMRISNRRKPGISQPDSLRSNFQNCW
jgi:hypothetical protein